jgi:hypothetical protein
VRPLQHVLGQPLIQKLPLKEKVDHGGAEVLTERAKIQAGDVHEPALAVETPFQHNGVQMGMEARELPAEA